MSDQWAADSGTAGIGAVDRRDPHRLVVPPGTDTAATGQVVRAADPPVGVTAPVTACDVTVGTRSGPDNE